MISYGKLSIFKKFLFALKARSNIIRDQIKFFKMRNASSLRDLYTSGYNKNLSYRINWFNLQKQQILGQWDAFSDQLDGGSSKAQFYFDQQNKCASFQGFIQAKDKDKIIYHPYINMMRTFPARLVLGPLRLVQIQAKTDGKPVQVHFNIKSFVKGQVNIYGFILSTSTQWHTYEIPLQNTVLRGTQQDYQEGQQQSLNRSHQNQYFSKINDSSIFDKQFQSVKKILNTELQNQNSLPISNIGFRLVSTQSTRREIKVRNINFCYKKGYEQFSKEYLSPYFYITDDKPQIQENGENKKDGDIQFISNSLESVSLIDTGDIKYYRNKNNSKNIKHTK